jgi:uncharacterized membrane protein
MASNIKLKEIKHPFWQVIGIGALAGMRTTAGPAISSQILSHHHSKRLERSPLNFMQSKTVANVLTALSVTEVIADKLPTTPNRTQPMGVIFRGLSGALAGASIYKASGNNPLIGSLLGATAAVASTFACYTLRKNIVKSTAILDPIIGAVEDAIVVGAGITLAQIA